jgi:hypothetical protein
VIVRRVTLTLLALVVFLPSMAFARAQFLCDVDLIVRDTCCCPPKKAKLPAHAPAMRRECCKIEKHTAAAAPLATVGTSSTWMPVAIVQATASMMPPIRHITFSVVPRAQAPPLERSLFSQHCALLV